MDTAMDTTCAPAQPPAPPPGRGCAEGRRALRSRAPEGERGGGREGAAAGSVAAGKADAGGGEQTGLVSRVVSLAAMGLYIRGLEKEDKRGAGLSGEDRQKLERLRCEFEELQVAAALN
jgi:hypothetical protein